MLVDSYRFLPRSFVPMYADAQPLADEADTVWAEFAPRLANARIALVTSAGPYLKDEQPPFDAELPGLAGHVGSRVELPA